MYIASVVDLVCGLRKEVCMWMGRESGLQSKWIEKVTFIFASGTVQPLDLLLSQSVLLLGMVDSTFLNSLLSGILLFLETLVFPLQTHAPIVIAGCVLYLQT